jgi:hypothetical protein
MKIRVAFAVLVVASAPVLLGACGGGGTSSTSAFCKQGDNFSVKYAALDDNPTRDLIEHAAGELQHIAGSAPSQVKAAALTEAAAYTHWAKTGDDSVLDSDSFNAADDQLSNWSDVHCKE